MDKTEEMVKDKEELDYSFHSSERFKDERKSLQLAFFCVLLSDGLAVPTETDLANVRTPGDDSGRCRC